MHLFFGELVIIIFVDILNVGVMEYTMFQWFNKYGVYCSHHRYLEFQCRKSL